MSIYFIRYGNSGAIKIGYAGRAADRIRNLQCASPEKIVTLAVVDGDKVMEHALHERFATLKVRARGEWFEPGPELLAFIANPSVVEATKRLNARTKSNSARSKFSSMPGRQLWKENVKMRTALSSLTRTNHYECEDGFYSCSKHPDYFGNGDRTRCDCGTDSENETIAAAALATN